MLEETYNNQLQTILFSVNQYSDDIVNSWANRIVEIKADKNLLPKIQQINNKKF